MSLMTAKPRAGARKGRERHTSCLRVYQKPGPGPKKARISKISSGRERQGRGPREPVGTSHQSPGGVTPISLTYPSIIPRLQKCGLLSL